MPYKSRESTTKKSAERKKTLNLNQVRTSRRLSHRTRCRYYLDQLVNITTHTGNLTQKEINLLKGLVAKGLLPKITWITSSPDGVNDKIKYALRYLHSEEAKSLGCEMQKGYDYAWIKIVLDQLKLSSPYAVLKCMSTPVFVNYIKSLGFKDIAGSKTLNKFIAMAHWDREGNRLSFPMQFIPPLECERRNNIVWKFLEILNEI